VVVVVVVVKLTINYDDDLFAPVVSSRWLTDTKDNAELIHTQGTALCVVAIMCGCFVRFFTHHCGISS